MSHGIFLLLAVLIIPGLLNKIPLASLAAVLIMIGLKLASQQYLSTCGKVENISFFHF
ncbi:MAG: hypothetical protein IPI90_10615 [Saprospiraceae bacterium]|nr:hypothetical protein [Candidatus Vicinibacter affinis]